MAELPKLVVADDHPLYREGVAQTLRDAGQFDVVGLATNADEALQLSLDWSPDVILLDISMPGGGLVALERIIALRPRIKAMMLTASENDADVMRALALGARGYVLKGVSGAQLVEIVSMVAGGGSYVSPSLAAQVLVGIQNGGGREKRAGVDDLTAREEQILRLVAQGKSNKEVARELDLQEKTIKHYMTSILNKLQVRNRVEAAVLAREVWPQ